MVKKGLEKTRGPGAGTSACYLLEHFKILEASTRMLRSSLLLALGDVTPRLTTAWFQSNKD